MGASIQKPCLMLRDFDPQLKKRFKAHAVMKDTSMVAIAQKLIRDYLDEQRAARPSRQRERQAATA